LSMKRKQSIIVVWCTKCEKGNTMVLFEGGDISNPNVFWQGWRLLAEVYIERSSIVRDRGPFYITHQPSIYSSWMFFFSLELILPYCHCTQTDPLFCLFGKWYKALSFWGAPTKALESLQIPSSEQINTHSRILPSRKYHSSFLIIRRSILLSQRVVWTLGISHESQSLLK
jgi:hypothetical protein